MHTKKNIWNCDCERPEWTLPLFLYTFTPLIALSFIRILILVEGEPSVHLRTFSKSPIRILWYLITSFFLSTDFNYPLPSEEMHPWRMIFPLPSLSQDVQHWFTPIVFICRPINCGMISSNESTLKHFLFQLHDFWQTSLIWLPFKQGHYCTTPQMPYFLSAWLVVILFKDKAVGFCSSIRSTLDLTLWLRIL